MGICQSFFSGGEKHEHPGEHPGHEGDDHHAGEHLDHVRTQIPYAVTTMGGAALCGYLGSALWSAYTGLGLGVVCVVGLLLLLGRNPDAEDG